MTFKLTMYEPPPDRRPYQLGTCDDGQWRGLTLADLISLLEANSIHPDFDRQRIDQGETILLAKRSGWAVRRRPDAVMEHDARRQMGLFR
jgi:hypothetical protein